MYEELIWKNLLANTRMAEIGGLRKRKILWIAAQISSQTLRKKYGERTRKRFAKDLNPLRQLFVLIFRRSATQHFSK